MANALTGTTHNFGTPYLTVNEYKSAPTAIDIDNLVYNSIDPLAQDTELANVIARASSWIDTHCNQILGATIETEQQRNRYRADGTIRFHPRYNPVIALTALSFGSSWQNMFVAPDCSIAWLEDQQIIFPYGWTPLNYTNQGPLSFGAPSVPQGEVFLKYTYINGYTNTIIVEAFGLADTLIVADGTGITAGQQLKIYDGLYAETVTVADTYVFGSKTVPLTDTLLYDHEAGVSISALPPAIKEAAILVTTSMLKIRGDNSLTMGVGTVPMQTTADTQNISGDMALAVDLLKPFRRIR